MSKGDTTCRELKIVEISSATDGVFDHHERYKYYCKHKKCRISLPCICMRHCSNYKPIGGK